MGSITYDKIEVTGGLGLKELRTFELCIEPNCHAIGRVSGIVDKEICLNQWKGDLQTQVIKILISNGDEDKKPIFSGVIQKAVLEEEAGFSILNLTLYSGTVALDKEKKCHSYQDICLTYEDIVNKAIGDTKQAFAIAEVGEDTSPKKPLIQYMETNWEFVKRLASHFHSVVYPEVENALPRLWFGFPDSSTEAELDCIEYTLGFSKRYYELGGEEAGYDKAEFMYYQVQSFENYNIGDNLAFQKRKWKVSHKYAKMLQGQLIFTYILCKTSLLSTKKQYNTWFTGMTLLGKVLSAQSETVKLHLDIDKIQDENTAYAYQWTPDTGSVMYCMPKVGTTVSLYFSEEDEQSGKAVNCIRTNGGACAGTSNPNHRGLSTEHGKDLFLKPESIGLSVEESGNHLKIEDDQAITMESKQKISIIAQCKVNFHGKNIIMETPTEMNLAKK